MQTKFKINDTVKIIKSYMDIEGRVYGNWNPNMYEYVNDGKIYTIEKVEECNGRIGYLFKGNKYWWDERLLERVGFAEGARVKVIEVTPVINTGIKALDMQVKREWDEGKVLFTMAKAKIGERGKVLRVDGYDGTAYVELEDGSTFWFPLECLEEVEDKYRIVSGEGVKYCKNKEKAIEYVDLLVKYQLDKLEQGELTAIMIGVEKVGE